jgi:hypothetical protein
MASWATRSFTALRCVKGNSAKLREKAVSACRRPRFFSVETSPISTLARTATQLDERRAKKRCSANERYPDFGTSGDAAGLRSHGVR